MFSIEFITRPYWSEARSEQVLRGRITLGAFSEQFESSLSHWTQTDYERHWVQAARQLDAAAPTSAFITNCYDPATANFIEWWPVWRTSQSLVFQNHLLFLTELEFGLDLLEPAIHLRPRVVNNEDGERISEWAIEPGAVTEWLRLRAPAN